VAKMCSTAAVGTTSRPPKWIKPQLTRLVDEAPPGDGWLHEIKYDGYRMHARIDGGKAKLLTRTGLDWSHLPAHDRRPAVAEGEVGLS
jgi:ATP-dependent DNA ligase